MFSLILLYDIGEKDGHYYHTKFHQNGQEKILHLRRNGPVGPYEKLICTILKFSQSFENCLYF